MYLCCQIFNKFLYACRLYSRSLIFEGKTHRFTFNYGFLAGLIKNTSRRNLGRYTVPIVPGKNTFLVGFCVWVLFD